MTVLRVILLAVLMLGVLLTTGQLRHGVQEKSDAAGSRKQADLQRAAAKGDAEAQYRIGQLALQAPPSSESRKRAEEWLFRAAKQGHVAAQLALGQLYQYGSHYDTNYRKAVRWLRTAAKAGNAEAWLALASIYTAGGYGVFQDREKALACYAKAEENAPAETYHQLAREFWHGRGVIAADWPRALANFLKAADKGHVESYHWVATCFELGIGTPADAAKAFQWFSKAAAKEHVPSMEKLVECYERGIGVARDLAQAKAWDAKLDARTSGDEKQLRLFRRRLKYPVERRGDPEPARVEKAPKFAEGVEVVLESDKTEYETDELIAIRVIYHNKEKKTFSWTRHAAEGSGPWFAATDAKGVALPYPFAERPHPPRISIGGGLMCTVVLKPGDKEVEEGYLNRFVPCDKPGVYKITTKVHVTEGSSGGVDETADSIRIMGPGNLACKVRPLQITLRAGDLKKRAAAIARLVQKYRSGGPAREKLKRHDPSGRGEDILWRLMLYRDSSVIPLFLDVLEKAIGSNHDGSYFATIGLNAMPNHLVVRALKERLEHPEKYNTPALLREYLDRTAPAPDDWLSVHSWRDWKREQEITRKYESRALELLCKDKDYRYVYLVPHLLGGSNDAFLVDYLLRARSDFDFVNGSYALQRVKVGREHLPRLEAMLSSRTGWTHIADAIIIQLVSMDRKRYLPELSKNPEWFSPEIRKMLEEDIEVERPRRFD